MELLQSFILGIIQGVGEFLPISSSGHLVLVPWILGWPYFGLAFDVALHMGTLFAVLAYFWKDWYVLCIDGIRLKRTVNGYLFWYLAAATIPGAIFGYLLESYAETVFRAPVLIGIMLILVGIILWIADNKAKSIKKLNQVSFLDSLIIGISQAFAIIPGVSRSGITMAAGRFLNLDRETSARFSFLLSTPIILGAGINQLTSFSAVEFDGNFIIGVVTSAVVGFISIKFLLSYLTRRNFNIFIWYRIIVGMLTICISFII
ncbi:MAG: undecaprenyl-diphosphate phosphatase [Clostridiales bacterium]|nr:undecaprenyl-diphosphate phosphatase [Clostridiales bacterium]MCF8023416.1 undecaprenyl-diphosphate phosphatase [Clostridiales bacterium]